MAIRTLLLFTLSALVFFVFLWLKGLGLGAPEGIAPLNPIDLHQLQGPWFEVARMDSAVEEDIEKPVLYLKFAGSGQDRMLPYPDPKDPRFRIILMGQVSDGALKRTFDVMTDPIKDYTKGTITLPCYHFFHCALHVITYDIVDRTWMVIAGPTKNRLWIFARAPGLTPSVMNDIKNRLRDWGYKVRSLTYGHELPKIQEIMPPNTEVMPIIPVLPKP